MPLRVEYTDEHLAPVDKLKGKKSFKFHEFVAQTEENFVGVDIKEIAYIVFGAEEHKDNSRTTTQACMVGGMSRARETEGFLIYAFFSAITHMLARTKSREMMMKIALAAQGIAETARKLAEGER